MTEFSFKDPGGFVYEKDKVIYRAIYHAYSQQYTTLVKSGLYDELIKEKLIIPFEVVQTEIENINSCFVTIKPEQVTLITYPYEWCFLQWKESLTVFLRINLIALKYGMILKDGTPFNMVFYNGGFKLMDTISFDYFDEKKGWIAYHQFCTSFLAPFFLAMYNGLEWLRFSLASYKGIDLKFVSKQLPIKSWFNFNCLIHIHFHSKYNKKGSDSIVDLAKTKISKDSLVQLINSLLKSIQKINLTKTKDTKWVNYYSENIQSDLYLNSKVEIIKKWLDKINPKSLIDLGSNNGLFTKIASEFTSDYILSIESDLETSNMLYLNTKHDPKILVSTVDISQPSPNLGWNNLEFISLIERLHCDSLMALAIIHHLRITNSIPLRLIVDLFSKIVKSFLIIEFIGKRDKMVQKLLANREDVFEDYNIDYFTELISEKFQIKEKFKFNELDRTIFLCLKK